MCANERDEIIMRYCKKIFRLEILNVSFVKIIFLNAFICEKGKYVLRCFRSHCYYLAFIHFGTRIAFYVNVFSYVRIIQKSGKMRPQTLLEHLAEKKFLDELHHLLWNEPFVKNGIRDEGWNCRDHSLLVAGIVRRLGYSCDIHSGKCAFVQGGNNNILSLSLEVNPHSYVYLLQKGIIDFSPRFQCFAVPLGFLQWPIEGIFLNKLLPKQLKTKSEIVIANNEPDFQFHIRRTVQHKESRALIYLKQGTANSLQEMLNNPGQTINSPLSCHLLNGLKLGNDIYKKALLQLWEFINERTTSLQSFSRDDAWKTIAELPSE